jgi:alkanesulfonate monooxygenase SsuD/methylene tetrahydromethanopterin reductase-like flavin-dependent oxidoreductase (luciferase family)
VQISLVGPIGDGPGRPVVDHYIEQLTRARDAGFQRVWTSPLPWEADLLTVLGVALREVDGIDVGTAALPIRVQHPSQLAQRALVVNQIAGGRLQLGLGLDHAGINHDVWENPFDGQCAGWRNISTACCDSWRGDLRGRWEGRSPPG